MKARCALAVCVVSSAAALAPSARADVVEIASYSAGSTEGLGAFVGMLEYVPQTATSGLLTVSLTNTSPAENGGLITGFVLRIGSADAGAAATLTGGSHAFVGLGPESAPPFGVFDAGAALGGSWTGGGNPNGGIAVGATGTFTFDVHAADAGSLTAERFITADEPYGFVVRMRGFANGGSDKVPGVLVPGPGAAGVLAAGLAMAGSRRRRRG